MRSDEGLAGDRPMPISGDGLETHDRFHGETHQNHRHKILRDENHDVVRPRSPSRVATENRGFRHLLPTNNT